MEKSLRSQSLMGSCETLDDGSHERDTLIYDIFKGVKVFQGILLDILYYISVMSCQLELKNQS